MDRLLNRRGVLVALAVLATTALAGCSDLDHSPLSPDDPAFGLGARAASVQEAMAAQERHSATLMALPGVIGTAVGLLPDGGAAVRVYVAGPDRPRIPDALDAVPVQVRHTTLFRALSDPTTRARPAPLGFSVGHPDITAGTIGARVVDGTGQVYVLSNNHVLAASNGAQIGDPALQPGPYDGGTLADQFATLADYYVIDFSFSGHNTIDAAIALTTTAELGNATPVDAGYGTPSSALFGDADGDGHFDDVADLLGLPVQKYGRTTLETHGQVTDINAFVEVCYVAYFGICLTSGYFFDQVIITPGAFSGPGDSGSLIVTDDAAASPVGLLFAGSETETIANRIDLVLDYFGVTIDGRDATPPAPVTDLAITAVDAPASAAEGSTVDVTVTVQNVGNQDVTGPFSVTLSDETATATIGTQSVAGLAAGASAALAFAWNTSGAATGGHTLRAGHDFPDDDAGNDAATATVSITTPGTPAGAHVGDLDASATASGGSWSATVDVALHDDLERLVGGALVRGSWSTGGTATCTTGTAGSGRCQVSLVGIAKRTKQVTFTVTAVTPPGGLTYEQGQNHDPDGDSDGTSVIVIR